jgi:hypothetical protein
MFFGLNQKLILRRTSMLNGKESKMVSMQPKMGALLARMASVAMLSVGLAATGTLSASAHDGPAPQSAAKEQFAVSTWHRHPVFDRNARYFGYAGPGRVFSPAKSVPDDGCDLPSTGCPSYLAN